MVLICILSNFPIYDPVGRRSKKDNSNYVNDYIKKYTFLRAITVRLVSTLYCFLMITTFILMNLASPNWLYIILIVIFSVLILISNVLSQKSKI